MNKDLKLVSRDTLLKRMHDHIFTVMSRYKGLINGWDVVNEALEDNGSLKNTLWYKIIGRDYIEKAFEFAHEADPNAELYYNDYSLTNPVKRDSALAFIKSLKAKGLRVDGVGEQGHYQLMYPKIEEVDSLIEKFSKLKIKVMFTELDISVLPFKEGMMWGADLSKSAELKKELDPYTSFFPDSMQTKLANRYADLFRVFKKHKNVVNRVTIWGVYDGQSWLNYWPIRGRTNYPLLFDREYKPKPAYYAVLHVGENI